MFVCGGKREKKKKKKLFSILLLVQPIDELDQICSPERGDRADTPPRVRDIIEIEPSDHLVHREVRLKVDLVGDHQDRRVDHLNKAMTK